MALRIRKDGRILCAALHPEESGDTYIDDGTHYVMSALAKVIVAEGHDDHMKSGQWWWRNNVPLHIVVDPYYLLDPVPYDVVVGDVLAELHEHRKSLDSTKF